MLKPCPEDIRRRLLAYLRERFGFDTGLLDPWEIYMTESARRKIFLGPKTDFPLERTDTGGVLIARAGDTIKPATSFFQMFGSHVTSNIVRLESSHVAPYCAGKDLELTADECGSAALGFVMVAWDSRPLGCGLLRRLPTQDLPALLENQVPKANRLTLGRF